MEKKKEVNLISSLVNMKCPKCRTGDLFETGTFSFMKPFDMHDKCTVCQTNFMPEPGFYYGAMFISYIIWGWFSILLLLGLVFIFEWNVNGAFVLLLFISAILFVWLFRFSRTIWIHINVKYQPHKR